MALIVREMFEDDIDAALKVQYAAFRTGQLGQLLSPAPEPPAEFLSSSKKGRLEVMQSNDAARFMVVEDTDANAIIAAAHWDIYPHERTPEQVEKLCQKSAPPPSANANLWTDFFGHFSQCRRQLGTRPIAVLHTLVTAPKHQGRGAGRLLMQKFVDEVDQAGLEAYLEASSAGRPLYAKFGFLTELVKEFDLQKYDPNSTGVEVNTVMLRPKAAVAPK